MKKTPGSCLVCMHKDRAKIEQRLLAGATYRSLEREYGISRNVFSKHKREHIIDALVTASDKKKEVRELTNAQSLIDQVSELKDKAFSILEKTEEAGSHTVSLMAIKEIRSIVELMAKISGEIQTGITIVLSPEWIELRGVIITALLPHMVAREAVLKAIEEHESKQ